MNNHAHGRFSPPTPYPQTPYPPAPLTQVPWQVVETGEVVRLDWDVPLEDRHDLSLESALSVGLPLNPAVFQGARMVGSRSAVVKGSAAGRPT